MVHKKSLLLLVFVCFCGSTSALLSMASETNNMSVSTTLEFYNPAHFAQAQPVHDTVMAGRSDGSIESVSEPEGLRFHGNLSSANNGGFVSVEFTLAEKLRAEGFNRIALNASAEAEPTS